MLTHAQEARERISGVTREQFLDDRDKQLAVTHLVMIVGEAAAQVSPERRAALPLIPWSKIVGTRNRIVHHYFKVDLDIIWEVAELHLPGLVEVLQLEVPADDGD